MLKKILSFLILLVFIFQNIIVFSGESLQEQNLYYMDSDNNGKIDTLEITFNKEITGDLDKTKLVIYSNTGGLSYNKIDHNHQIIENLSISGTSLIVKIFEQDLENIHLVVNNTATSHLRIRNNSGLGIIGVDGSNFTSFSYTESFLKYKNVLYKENSSSKDSLPGDEKEENNDEEGNQDNLENIQTGSGETYEEDSDIAEEKNEIEENQEAIKETEDNQEKSPDNLVGDSQNQENNEEDIGEEQASTGIINAFTGQIFLIFQNPTYLLEKDIEKAMYDCDRTKTDCRVNFHLNIDEGSGSKSIPTKYNCEWNFGFDEITGEENKCNPNTITYPEGIFEISFKVIEKSNPNNYFEKKITIKNEGFQEEVIPPKIIYVGGGSSSVSTYTPPQNIPINIETPKIIVQSGIDENNHCKKDDCNLNLDYEVKNSKESCFWSFPGGSYSAGTEKKCNPGYVKYPLGDFKVTLRVFEAGNENNYKESYLYFSNKSENKNIKQDENKQIQEIGNHPVSKITLQGTVGKDKELSGKYLYCFKESCSVNFDGRESYSLEKQKLEYFWDFGNGETFSGNNPGSITFTSGEYIVKLKVTQENGFFHEDDFFVRVGKNIEKEVIYDDTQRENKNFPLKIIKVLPNPVGVDHAEWIEITNFGNEKINLKGCEIDDEIKKASKPYKIDKDLFLEPQKSKRFYKFDTDITLKNTSGEQVNFVCFGDLIDNLTWTFDTPDGFIVTPEIVSLKSGKVFIESVVDGDTFIVQFENGTKKIIRHIGIDTPETKHPKKEVEKYGLEAIEFAKKYFEGKNAYFILDSNSKNFIDNYSRVLGYLSLDNKKTYGEDILSTGLAKVYDKKDFDLMKNYTDVEKISKQKRLGIWGSYGLDFSKENLNEKDFDIESLEIDEDLKKEFITNDEKRDILKDFIDEYQQNENIDTNINIKQKITDIVNKSFTQKISKQKKGIKIYGQTLPNTHIVFQMKKMSNDFSFLDIFIQKTFASHFKYFQTYSDNSGKYELFIKNPEIGDFEITSVLKTGNEVFEVLKRNAFDVDADYIEYITPITKKDNQKVQIVHQKIPLKSIITLQGKIASQHRVGKDKIICKNVNECSVNLDGRESTGNKGMQYSWNFGNGNTFLKSNPSSYKFSVGSHVVSLKVSDGKEEDISYFFIEVEGKIENKSEIVPVKKNTQLIQKNPGNTFPVLYEKNTYHFLIHIFGITIVFFTFFIGSFILLRKQEIL